MAKPRFHTIAKCAMIVIAGTGLGYLIDLVYADNWPPVPQIPYPVFGPLCWGFAFAILAVAGEFRKDKHQSTRVFKAFVIGIVAGALFGASVYPVIMAGEFIGAHTKEHGFLVRQGVFFGMPTGACLGVLITIGLRRNRSADSPSPTL